MATPAYHLRTNKAVDRLLFLDALHMFETASAFAKYVYYSFGGPYLDDFRLMHEHFPKMKMVSIELLEEVFERQRFHKPTGYVTLMHSDLHTFLTNYDAGRKKGVFWLDYTKLELAQFEEFMMLLGKVNANSIVKITLQCQPMYYQNKIGDEKKADGTYKNDKNKLFRDTFQDFLPSSSVAIPHDPLGFARLLQDMVQIAAQKALPSAAGGLVFQPVSSFYYKDGAGIFTLTGIVCDPAEQDDIKEKFSKWAFANLDLANPPKEIDVPVLSTKERLHLQKYLPCKGEKLAKALGYPIGDNNAGKMQQYADFYRQYPYFIRAVV
jgi:hypothetical protein